MNGHKVLMTTSLDPADFGEADVRPHVLQGIVFPNEGRADRTSLFVKWRGEPRLDLGFGLTIATGSFTEFSTFFNSFSHRKWHDLTGIDRISLQLAGSGRVEVLVNIFTETGAALNIHREILDLAHDGTNIELPALSSLSGELIGFHMRGDNDYAILKSAAWVTNEPARRAVHLAAVITTFRREAAINRAMASFSSDTCASPPLGRVELLVIDNEQKLPPSALAAVTVIPNENLGGAGGFARGLKEAADSGRFTHVLFMDDDAACEPESVWRSMALLAYMQNPLATVAGSMFLADRPCIQHEKGGRFDASGTSGCTWISNKHHFDLADLARVCENEVDIEVNYGAWWFFAFPLPAIKNMPFPFFVRGDDVDFSLSNGLKVVTLNGIATWCDNFGTKLDPATEYLSYRGWMAVALMHGNKDAAFLVLWNSLRLAQAMARRFDYVAMNAVLDGIDDAMKGPAFFGDNPVPMEKIKKLKASQPVSSLSRAEFDLLRPQTFGSKIYGKLARLSMAGNLFRLRKPANPCRHTIYASDFTAWGLTDADKAVVGDGLNLAVLTRDRKAFFVGSWRISATLWKYRFRLLNIQRQYKEEAPAFRTDAYWQALFRRGSSEQSS